MYSPFPVLRGFSVFCGEGQSGFISDLPTGGSELCPRARTALHSSQWRRNRIQTGYGIPGASFFFKVLLQHSHLEQGPALLGFYQSKWGFFLGGFSLCDTRNVFFLNMCLTLCFLILLFERFLNLFHCVNKF